MIFVFKNYSSKKFDNNFYLIKKNRVKANNFEDIAKAALQRLIWTIELSRIIREILGFLAWFHLSIYSHVWEMTSEAVLVDEIQS